MQSQFLTFQSQHLNLFPKNWDVFEVNSYNKIL